jgi:hypothetical protein
MHPKNSTPRVCSVEGCGRRVVSRGWCGSHYRRFRLYGDALAGPPIALPLSLAERFWRDTEKSDGCWLWRGAINHNGYGLTSIRGRGLLAHRASWLLHFGSIPTGMFVCHHCDNPPCVRPDHLFLGTAEANNRDKARKGRSPRGDHNGARRMNERLPHGERSPHAKLSSAQVDEIRTRYATGEISQSQLGRTYGVSQGHIWRILHHRERRLA